MSKSNKKNNLAILVVIILVGFAAGALGQLTINYYFSEDIYSDYFNSDLTLNQANKKSFIIREPKKVVVEEDRKVKEVHEQIKRHNVFLFQNPDLTIEGIDYYNFNSSLLNGIILTNDGWTVFPYEKNLINPALLTENYKIADNNKKIYNISDHVLGKNNNFIFLKLEDAQDLEVASFVEPNNMELGQTLIAVNSVNNVLKTSLVSWEEESNLVKHSDELDKNIVLREELTSEFNTGAIYNLSGKIVAFIKNQEIYPLDNFESNWSLVLFKEKPQRANLGVYYINLDKTIQSSEKQLSGALVYHPSLNPVETGTPAEEIGLKAGDIIMYINDKAINKDNDLNEIIAQFKPQDRINITLKREGEVKTISTILEKNN